MGDATRHGCPMNRKLRTFDSEFQRDSPWTQESHPSNISICPISHPVHHPVPCGQCAKVQCGQMGPAPWICETFEGHFEVKISNCSG